MFIFYCTSLFFIFFFCQTEKGWPLWLSQMLFSWYKALVRSLLEYSAVAWYPYYTKMSDLRWLEKVKNRFLGLQGRYRLNIGHPAHDYRPINELLGLEPLLKRRIRFCCNSLRDLSKDTLMYPVYSSDFTFVFLGTSLYLLLTD